MKKDVLFLLMLVSTLIAQAATDYNFYVGGVKVTSDNCSNITGSNITSGTAVFTPSNNTLTLTNVTITRTGTDNRAIQSDRSGLIVKLVRVMVTLVNVNVLLLGVKTAVPPVMLLPVMLLQLSPVSFTPPT